MRKGKTMAHLLIILAIILVTQLLYAPFAKSDWSNWQRGGYGHQARVFTESTILSFCSCMSPAIFTHVNRSDIVIMLKCKYFHNLCCCGTPNNIFKF